MGAIKPILKTEEKPSNNKEFSCPCQCHLQSSGTCRLLDWAEKTNIIYEMQFGFQHDRRRYSS